MSERLDKLAEKTARSKTFYIRECLRKYLTELELRYQDHTPYQDHTQ